jgi:hypothetical protein
MDQLRLLTLKNDLLKISVHLRTGFAAEIQLAEGQWLKEQLTERGKVTYVRSRNTNADSLEDRGETFSAIKGIY